MPIENKPFSQNYFWNWEDAFLKFGFGDGDDSQTDKVAKVLKESGYSVKLEPWPLHNTVIDSIIKNNQELIPDDSKVSLGYDDPRDYLPEEIINLLDEKFGADKRL